MKEIEVKFQVKNFKKIVLALMELGAQLEWKGVEVSYFFDNAEGTLRKEHKNLRLRKWEGEKNILTLKTPAERTSKKYKIKNEYEIVVDNIDRARNLLKHLGFQEYLRYKKHREHWKLPDAAIELDTLMGHHFVEVEAPKKRIDELAHALGLEWSHVVRQGYVSILRELNALGDDQQV